MAKKIIPKEEHCIGCQLCEIYCAVEHSKSKNIYKFLKEHPKPVRRVIVEANEDTSFALSCRHCEDAPCVKACISGAMTKDPNSGVVANNPDKCVGCWMCLMVCPFGSIHKGQEKIALKCDYCPDADEPVCVVSCPQEALIYVDDEESPESGVPPTPRLRRTSGSRKKNG